MTLPPEAPALPVAETTTRASRRPADWLGLMALILLTFVTYWPSMNGGFIWQDRAFVTDNLCVVRPDGIERIWIGLRELKAYPAPQLYPMTFTTFWAQSRFQDATGPWSTWPFHLINVLLHLGSAILLWGILRRLAISGAFAAAAVWALHPVQVESVAWITQRSTVLSGFFFFAAMLIYLRFAGLDDAEKAPSVTTPPETASDQIPPETPHTPETSKIGSESPTESASPSGRAIFSLPDEPWKLYTLALVLFLCAILSRPIAGVLPAVMLLVMWWKWGKIRWAQLMPLIPFFVCAIAMGVAAAYFEQHVRGAHGQAWQRPLYEKSLIAGGGVWFYAGKLLWPMRLTFIYPRWQSPSIWLTVGLFAAIAMPIVLLVLHRRIGRGPLVIVLLFGGTLLPALGFVNLAWAQYSFVADRFQYLASAALIVGVVWLLHRFFTSPRRFAIACGLILGSLTAVSWAQNSVYHSAVNLWHDTLAKNPGAWIAHLDLGKLYLEAGQLDDAEVELLDVLKARPRQVEAKMYMGLVAERRGNAADAITWMHEAIASAKEDSHRTRQHAPVYFHLGRLLQLRGEHTRAMQAYQEAYEADPRHVPTLNAIGALHLERNDLENARVWLTRTLEIDPMFLQAHTNMGNLLYKEGDLYAASLEYRLVLEQDPRNVAAISNSAILVAQQGDMNSAIKMLERALAIEPEYEPAKRNLALLERLGREAATRPATTQSATAPTTGRSTAPAISQ